jgi:hypothetical protein
VACACDLRRGPRCGEEPRQRRRYCADIVRIIRVGLIAAALASAVAWAPTDATALPITTANTTWITADTGVKNLPSQLEGAPSGVGLVVDRPPDQPPVTYASMPDGSIRRIGTMSPSYWLGTTLIGAVGEQSMHRDVNGDGDQTDTILAISVNYHEPTLHFASYLAGHSCGVRLNADMAVICRPEGASNVDANNDGDLEDAQMMIIRSSGAIETTTTFVGPNVASSQLFADGSATIGPYRVRADGSITPSRDPSLTMRGVVGQTDVGYSLATSAMTILPPTGPAVTLAPQSTIYSVGNAMWINELSSQATPGRGLCRVRGDGSLSCTGIQARFGYDVMPLGDDSAIVTGSALTTTADYGVYLVPVEGAPILLDVHASEFVVDLGDGSALVGSHGFDTDPPRPRLYLVRRDGSITTVPLPAGGALQSLSLGDGRAFVTLVENTDMLGEHGVDLNGDGDLFDAVEFLYSNGSLTKLGADVNMVVAFGHPGAVALEPGGPIMVGIDESREPNWGVVGTDLNGDGDLGDMVLAVLDNGVFTNLGLVLAKAQSMDTVTAMIVKTGPRQALFAVYDGSPYTTYSIRDPSAVPAFTSMSPTRVLDTRADGPQAGYSGPKPVAGQTITVTAPAGAGAVALNVTGLDVEQTGFVTVYPCGEPLPTVSNLNLTPGLITPNMVISKVGIDGTVCIYTQRSADLIADVAGTFSALTEYAASTPRRVLDTRPDSQVGYDGAMPAAGRTVEVTAPAGSTAAVMNVTGLDSADTGFVTVYPCGEARPTASNLNLTPGVITPNLTITKVGANGKVCIFTQRSANLIADLAGVFPAGSRYHPLTPERLVDTRVDTQIGPDGMPVAGQTISIAAPPGAGAVVMNVTGLDAEQDGFVTVYPCGGTVPTASNLNLSPGRITPNLTVTQVGVDGKVCIFTQRSANLIADLVGSFPR